MADNYRNYNAGLESPASDLLEITPSDTIDLQTTVRGINVAASGNVKVRTIQGTDATVYIAAGSAFPVRAVRVFATGTTATGIVGLI